MINFIHQHQW